MNNKHKVIFFGTPWIAKECLAEIKGLSEIEIVAVVCQPDKEFNRKKEVVYGEVRKYCIDNNIKLFQPHNLMDIYNDLNSLKPDIFITCAYGKFINDEILKIPRYKCVNIHASLLPKLRGGAPIHRAIINQEKETGITFMYSEKEMDAGNIIFQEKITIDNNETYKTLLIKLCNLSKRMIKEKLLELFNDNLKSIKQDITKVSFGYNIKKEETFIDWNLEANKIDSLIRGLNDKPVAKFDYNGNIIKVYECIITNNKSKNTPGTIVTIDKNGIEISCKDYNLLITKIQLPSKKISFVYELINGNSLSFLKTNS